MLAFALSPLLFSLTIPALAAGPMEKETKPFPLFGVDLRTGNCAQMRKAVEEAGAKNPQKMQNANGFVYEAVNIIENAQSLGVICSQDGTRVGMVSYVLAGTSASAVAKKLQSKYGEPTESPKKDGDGWTWIKGQPSAVRISVSGFTVGAGGNKLSIVNLQYWNDDGMTIILKQEAANMEKADATKRTKEAPRF